MDIVILKELEEKIALAIDKGLIPQNKYKEIEFTVDADGRASHIEFWNSSERLDCSHVVVEIPKKLLSNFVFRNTANHL